MADSNFVDYVKICCRSGKGGKGSTHLHRDKSNPKGGPDGGDGGRGGHIILKGNKQLWTLIHLKYRKHVIAAPGGITALVTAVAAGLGIAGLPDHLAAKQTNLVRLLPENPGPDVDVFFIYPADLRRSKRIAAFRQYLIDQAADWKK